METKLWSNRPDFWNKMIDLARGKDGMETSSLMERESSIFQDLTKRLDIS